jgi:hypothetical protein
MGSLCVPAALKQAVKDAQEGKGEFPDFDGAFEECMAARGKGRASSYENHAMYKEIVKLLEPNRADEDEELEVVQTQVGGWVGLRLCSALSVSFPPRSA